MSSPSSSPESKTLGTTEAWIIVGRGLPASPSVLQYTRSHPLPALKPGQVRVRMKVAAVYSGTAYAMRVIPTWVRRYLLAERYEIADLEGSGVVEEVYPGGDEWKVGDEVFGMLNLYGSKVSDGFGALATYATFRSNELNRKPEPLTWEEAAGLHGHSQTVYYSLVETGKLSKGWKLFINGGSTSVGLSGIQIAKAFGAYVVVSCSKKNFDLVKQVGADEVIDYTENPLHEQLSAKFSVEQNRGFDMIYDTVGSPQLFRHSPSYLVPRGECIVVGVDVHSFSLARIFLDIFTARWLSPLLGGTARVYKFLNTVPNQQRGEKLVELANNGLLHVPIDSVWKFNQVREAYARTLTGRARGKVVVRIPGPEDRQ